LLACLLALSVLQLDRPDPESPEEVVIYCKHLFLVPLSVLCVCVCLVPG
jgi:hypothetical protein